MTYYRKTAHEPMLAIRNMLDSGLPEYQQLSQIMRIVARHTRENQRATPQEQFVATQLFMAAIRKERELIR